MKHSVKVSPGTPVLVGLSGGVDSAVTAALLQRSGAKVEGVFVKGWYPPGMPCTWAEERRDAMRVAARLGIPFRTLDASEAYRQGVIEYLVREYRLGRTPNPDVMCNREVKFGVLHALAKKEGALLATGHYARTEDGTLYRGVEAAKDQSYFLWAVPMETLRDVLFPLGGMRKEETRTLAREFNLPVADKRDSQGICFLGAVSVDDFLRAEFGIHPGDAVDTGGNRIGTHDGALLVTLGERVALTEAAPGPWYVLSKDVANNTITVSHERSGATTRAIELQDVNLFGEEGKVAAQLRYHGPLVPGEFSGTTFTPSEAPIENVVPGQSLVMYRGEECVGGGIIR